MPGVWLTALRTDKFKTGTLSVTLLSQLRRETAALNAAVPSVLRRGSVRCPDMESAARELESLYGAALEPAVRRIGEIQAVGFLSSFAAEACLPAGAGLLRRVCAFMGDMLLAPNTRGGLLLPDYVDSEREKQLERIRGRVNDKYAYTVQRLIENMCACEDFSVYKLGSEQEAEAMTYLTVTRRYRELAAHAPAEVFYCGGADPAALADALREALSVMPRGDLDDDIGTDIRMNAMEEAPRLFTERMDVTQGKLAIGWRLGACMEDPDPAALRVMNAVFGGGVTSKLFLNVREKLSLCYYASSVVDLHKGLLLVTSGIDFDKFDAARDEIFAQLRAVQQGDITDGELDAAKKFVASGLRAVMDSPLELENWWLSQNLDGSDCAPDELAALCEAVTREDVVRAASGAECDAIYFLKGGEGEDDGE